MDDTQRSHPLPPVFLYDPQTNRRTFITHFPFIIGRGQDCDLPLMDKTVSRLHARIEFKDGLFSIVDINSKHGTWVDNFELKSIPRPLVNGSQIIISQKSRIEMRFCVYDPEAPTADQAEISLGLVLDRGHYEAILDSQKHVALTTPEFEILELLVSHAGNFVLHDEIHRRVWPREKPVEADPLRIYKLASRLRIKLAKADPDYHNYIKSSHRQGWRYNPK